MRFHRAAALPLVLVVLALCFGSGAASRIEGAVKKKAPNFQLRTSDGTVIELSKLKGKVVVLNFWATWCGPCRSELAAFNETYGANKARGVEIVGISVDEGGWKDVKPFLKQYPVGYPVVLGTDKVVHAFGGVDAIPTTFIIDRDGYLADRHLGALTRSALEALFARYL